MNNIYLLYNFNNYFNRQVKRFSTLAEYKTAVNNNFISVPNVINFTPNDGVDTKQIFNVTALNVAAGTPDYMLVVDDNDVIESRWFVIDTERTRAQQYIFHLYRDTIAEAWEQLQNAPVFVEKGILSQSDPMILNPENMTFNQIKNQEILLKDFTEVPWIVGYLSQEQLSETSYSFDSDIISEPYTNKSDYAYNTYVTNDFNYGYFADEYAVSVEKLATARDDKIRFSHSISFYTQNDGWNSGAPYIADESKGQQFAVNCKNNCSMLDSAMETALSIQSAANKAAFDNQQDKIIYITSEQKYYKVNITQTLVNLVNIEPATASTMWNAMTNLISESNNGFLNDTIASSGSFRYSCVKWTKRIEYQEITPSTINYTIPHTRHKLSDQPYCMFAMPFGYCKIVGFDGQTEQHWENVTMKVAQNISYQLGGESPALYDLQLLPYFPIPELRNDAGNIKINGLTEGVDYSYITQDNSKVGIMFWATKSNHSFDIIRPITVSDYKINNETEMYRLCSPNFSGSFDFSAAKNGGVTKFNIDFVYKPYNPYIHVNPDFGKLYGSDFNDARGLICGGKFDLPQTTSAWETYERTNSNYNNIFNRQIENLEINQETQRIGEITGMISGAVGAGITGGMAGGAAGAIGAFGLSAAAGIADIALSERLRSETMDYTKDMYGYQLGNIKALPVGLTSVGSQTPNNKLFPFLEIYNCTEAEKNALIEKIRYNGMSVGRVGTIEEFSSNTWTYSNGWNYFKGKLIRLEIDGEDWHFVNTIKSELDRGIFIKEA